MAMCRLIVCFDGTWNAPDKGEKPTNVVKVVRTIRDRCDDGTRQMTFYDKGVGTGDVLDRVAGGASGKGLTENVVDGYRFLANNYCPGDEVYIFGFSRGAFTARSLAGLIGLSGLLEPTALGVDLDKTLEIYRKHELTSEQRRAEFLARGFPTRDSVRIKCIGVWDTVGSLGVPSDLGRRFLGGKYFFHDVELSANVDVALHAVAVDEKRSAFAPTLWVSKTGEPLSPSQIVEQVWFAGAHSNVGGSYADSGLSDIAFDWMARRVAKHTGLALDAPADLTEPPQPIQPGNCTAKGVDSRSALYADSRAFPYQRVIHGEIPPNEGFGGWFRKTFSDFDRRNIPPDGLRTVNEALHRSVLDRWQCDAVAHDCKSNDDTPELVEYRPVNLAAAIAAHKAGRPMPVVGWDGEVMDAAQAPWPA